MSYLDNLYQIPINENNQLDGMFSIVAINSDSESIHYNSVSNFNELCNLMEKLQSHYGSLYVLQTLLDSLKENNVEWVQDEDVKLDEFKYIKWPDQLLIEKKGICQDFAILVYLLSKHLKISCRLVFLLVLDAENGESQYGHVYPILYIDNKYWFWNFSEYIASMHGPYVSIEDCLHNSTEYFRALFNAIEVQRYNPLKLKISKNNPRIIFFTCVSDDNLTYILKNYNKKISKLDLWKNIEPVCNIVYEASQFSMRIKSRDLMLIGPKINELKFMIPCSKFKFIKEIKSLGKIYHLSK